MDLSKDLSVLPLGTDLTEMTAPFLPTECLCKVFKAKDAVNDGA